MLPKVASGGCFVTLLNTQDGLVVEMDLELLFQGKTSSLVNEKNKIGYTSWLDPK
jgi:hypothetical protein